MTPWVSSVETARVGGRIGALPSERAAQILAGLRFLQATFYGR